MTNQPRIGECESCRARFSIPASFRADRARCRECGGVVLISGTQPVPRPALERRRSVKPVQPRDERRQPAITTAPAIAEAPSKPAPREPEPVKAAVKPPAPVVEKAPKTKKPGGVIASIVTAVFRKKRGKS